MAITNVLFFLGSLVVYGNSKPRNIGYIFLPNCGLEFIEVVLYLVLGVSFGNKKKEKKKRK